MQIQVVTKSELYLILSRFFLSNNPRIWNENFFIRKNIKNQNLYLHTFKNITHLMGQKKIRPLLKGGGEGGSACCFLRQVTFVHNIFLTISYNQRFLSFRVSEGNTVPISSHCERSEVTEGILTECTKSSLCMYMLQWICGIPNPFRKAEEFLKCIDSPESLNLT